MTESEDTVQKRGLYMIADTPRKAMPVLLEDGTGDKQLLAEYLGEELATEELYSMINRILSYYPENGEKPCGNWHPLPCGLDVDCDVPSNYFDATMSNHEIWDNYTGDDL